MSRSRSLIIMAFVAVLAVGLALARGPLGVSLAGVLGLAATFGVYWKSREAEAPYRHLSRRPSDAPSVDAQPEPDADAPKHWRWQALSGGFSAALIVLGFALAA
jgi:hypothetical protein